MKESVRAGRHGAFLDDLGRDVRYAFRLFARQRTFAAVIVGTLALGIGANVALFSVVNSVLLRPLPYHEADRLVRLRSTNQANNLIRVGFSLSRFLEVQQRQQVFSDLALSTGNAFTLTGRGDPEQVIGLHASAALLPTLGLQPIIGRNFSPDEDRRGGSRVVLISPQMWQQRFNRDASVLGQALTLDDAPYAIIGVLPEAATAFPFEHLQVWVPRPAEVPVAQSQLQGGSYFFTADRASRTGRLARTSARGDERDRGGLPRGVPREPRRTVDDRAHAAPGRCGRRAAAELSAALWCGGMRAADRVREHRQPAARALCGKTTRDRGAVCARREPWVSRASARLGKHAARGAWRRRRPAARQVDGERAGRLGRGPDSARR